MADSAKSSKEHRSDGAESSSKEPEEVVGELDTGWLHRLMLRTLRVPALPPVQLLPFVSLEGVAAYMLTDRCKYVITVAGKGISESAEFPDHRSKEGGLFKEIYKYTSSLTSPKDLFSIKYFRKTPRPFFLLAKQILPGKFKPTPSHYFIKLLDDKGKLLRHYTQNIDSLERACGLDDDKLVEAYGTFHTSHCQICNKEFDEAWLREQILSDVIPRCDEPECNGVVKPDIVFFGEDISDRFKECFSRDLVKCNMLIVMGTNLNGQLFATLTSRVPFTTPRLYINLVKGRTVTHPYAAMMFGGRGFNFDGQDNYRDVFLQATCDDGCYALADLLGWGDELRKMVEKGNKKKDEQTKEKTETSEAEENPIFEVCKETSKSKKKKASKRWSSFSKNASKRNSVSGSKLKDKEVSKTEGKTVSKAGDKTASKIKYPNPKGFSGLKGNTISKLDSKEQSKSDSKEHSKSDSKEQSKSDSKAQSNSDSKEQSKSDRKEQSKSDSKAQSKSNSNKQSKSDSKEQSKSDSKEQSKSDSKAQSKSDSKEQSKSDSKEQSKFGSKEQSKSDSKEQSKSDIKEQSKP